MYTALDAVKPETVYLIGISPVEEKTVAFLSRLAGLVKFVIRHRGGKSSVQELAVVTGQREGAVWVGLEWLAAGGHVSITGEGEAVLLSRGKGESNQYLQKELFVAVRGILEETTAYRAYFARANISALMETPARKSK